LNRILLVNADKSSEATFEFAINELSPPANLVRALSVEEALNKLVQYTDIERNRPFELVITDTFLAGAATGLDLWRVFYKIYPDIPFLIISNLSFYEINQNIKTELLSEINYLRKPVIKESLVQKIIEIPATAFSINLRSRPDRLLSSESVHNDMNNLVVLELILDWLEKQDWLNEPYGGQNPVQELVFQCRLSSKQLSESFFSSSRKSTAISKKAITEKILNLVELAPQLKNFYLKHST